ncbi:mitogen-activated protein kinase kinase kinase 5 [Arachis stenosperma]|uniref:mitogen-activated protein kinase kinase kinase 5 n=1 Tax=Arachis stenosperma TaxID=217475 RepID=UPI0025AD8043|nr:mitogen-activated protein kinase kinase kinase 5 [Arachis stenosperma]
MRWLPSNIFTPPHPHSSSSSTSHSPSSSLSSSPSNPPPPALSAFPSSGRTLQTSTSTSSLTDLLHPRKKPSQDWTRRAWIFGCGIRPSQDDDLDDDDSDAVVPMARSKSINDRTYTRSQTSSSTSSAITVAPQPLPLPAELSFHRGYRHSSVERRSPSPKRHASGNNFFSSSYKGLDERELRVDALIIDSVPVANPYPPMRSVFASARNSNDSMERRVPGVGPQENGGYGGGDNNQRMSVSSSKSAPGSLFESPTISPQNMRNDDFVPYQYTPPKHNHFWSAPEIIGGGGGAFFDLSPKGMDANSNHSPHHSPKGTLTPRHGNSKSPTRPSSPIQTMSIDNFKPQASFRRDVIIGPINNVHPLPLPPPTALTSPTAAHAQSQAGRNESCSMQSQWQKGKLIGRGTFGSVYVATNRETGALCAMKEVEIFADDPKSKECIKQLEQEIKILSNLKHPNIVQYYGSEIVGDKFYIYLEYVYPGSINKYVREHCGAVTESVVRNFTRHILSGLAYLHSTKTIHRDIKGANLLVDSTGVVKLADFGMSKHLTGHAADLSLKGSPYWMAPELMHAVMQRDNNSDLALAVDIWSLGCTIIEMFTGKPPWSEYEGAAAMFKVLRDIPPIPEQLSSEGKDFLRRCFRRNPAERPNALMLLDHRFVKHF